VPLRAGDESASDLLPALREQEKAWARRPLLRRLYREWYQTIIERLASVPGTSIELGSGIGRLREIAGERIVLTDIEKTPWVDEQVDALNLPYGDASLANIVMLDVFHHLANSAGFLDEADRTLAPGGRVVMIEPYCSPVSALLYRRFHHERTNLEMDPFSADPGIARAPLESNQALPTLMFYRHRDTFGRRWPALRVVEERRFAFLLYPLSGGFSRPSVLPPVLYRPIRRVEQALSPLSSLLAFRCLVVLEKARALKPESA
jgi:SAM-dependent methyltransferase